jgi:hypothetical protein
MKGKYKRKRLNKKHQKYVDFIENICGIKLYLWQKIYMKKILKIKNG